MRASDNLNGYTAAGVAARAATSGSKGITLVNSTTYYVPVPSQIAGASEVSLHLKWAAAVAATITVEVSDFNDVTEYSATAGDWQQWNATDAPVQVTGSGNSATAATITAGGSAAGAAFIKLDGQCARRYRLKIVVTTGGLCRIAAHGK